MSVEGSNAPPLSGIRILDFSRIIAGPLCTQQLSDMGAEVIKIENPDGGDDTRRFAEPGVAGLSHFFLAFNRNKRSVALDIRKPEALEILHTLAADCDVLVQNFRPGVMKRFSLDYDSMAERHPHLIYLSISAYGLDGPMAHRPGFDPVLQAEFGMMSMTGEPDGPALRHPLSIIDTFTALHAVGAVTAALYARKTTGRGQHLDLTLMDSAVAALGNAGLYYLSGGGQPPRSGNSHMTSTPTTLVETADGPMYMALGTNRLFGQLCRDVLDRPDLESDPRFETPDQRFKNRPELFALLREIFATQPRAHWMERMRHLPAGPVRNLAEALESEEVAHRKMVVEVPHESGETIRLLGSPLKFSDTPVRTPSAPPALGAHTDDVLRNDAGLDDAAIQALRDSGVIG
ncbi:MAG: CoA transferase [Chromatiales bacterium]|jgi:crotonobetainyl-CoA:carnitine CoA-transferase CaiB-like acyl-CoA transferase|nr:CoA transferase [Chromatiales bacterium]